VLFVGFAAFEDASDRRFVAAPVLAVGSVALAISDVPFPWRPRVAARVPPCRAPDCSQADGVARASGTQAGSA
jgi:hypothetical protein